jgi:hypothetical protein
MRIVSISLAVWMASPFFIINPFLADTELAATRAIGVAKPSAHGHAITSVATNEKIAVDSGPASVRTQGMTFEALIKKGWNVSYWKNQIIPLKTANEKTVGIKYKVILSARA